MVASRRKERSTPKRSRDRQPVRARAVSLSVLLGIVPVLMPAPPRFCFFSTKATRLPNRVATQAAVAPAGPPPITTKSYSLVSMIKPLKFTANGHEGVRLRKANGATDDE